MPKISKDCRNYLLWPLLGATILSLILWYFPSLDMSAERVFYDPLTKFEAGNHGVWGFLRDMIPWISKGIVVAVVGLYLAGKYKRKVIAGMNGKVTLYLLIALLIGPGIVVHPIIKNHWGRARPHQIVEFGGDKQFSPAWVMTDQCKENCSFVSGHASIGFFLVAFALAFPLYRKHFFGGGLALGLAVSLARMAQGAHFLSDVLLAGVVVYFCALLTYLVIFRRWPDGHPLKV